MTGRYWLQLSDTGAEEPRWRASIDGAPAYLVTTKQLVSLRRFRAAALEQYLKNPATTRPLPPDLQKMRQEDWESAVQIAMRGRAT